MSTVPIGTASRSRASVEPAMILRSWLAGGVAVAAAPLLAIAGILAVSNAFGADGERSPLAEVGKALSTDVVLFIASALSLLIGVLAVASVHMTAHAGDRPRTFRALGRALGSLPRLLASLLVVGLGLVLALVGWPLLSVGALVLAGVRWIRERASMGPIRAALRWAIPLLPVLALAGVALASVPAALSRPGSVRGLLRIAVDRVRTAKSSLLLLAIVVAPVSAGLTWAGLSLGASASLELSVPLLGALLVLLMSFTGAAVAILTPVAVDPPTSLTPPRSGAWASARLPVQRRGGLLRWPSRALGRTAVLTVAALASTLFATPALAVEAPVLTVSAEGSGPAPAMSARVELADTDVSGTVQFLIDDSLFGDPVPLVTDPDAPGLGTAALTGPALSPGDHQVSFSYEPTNVDLGTSSATAVTYTVSAANLTPTLTVSVEGDGTATPLVAATVQSTGYRVMGSVQLIVDDARVGDFVPLGVGDDTTQGLAELPLAEPLAVGSHEISFAFRSSSERLTSGDATARTYVVLENIPTLRLDVEGTGASPVLTANVQVAGGEPTGTVQFYDDAAPLGDPVTLALNESDLTSASATLTPAPVLEVGSHVLSFGFVATDPAVADGVSPSVSHVVEDPDADPLLVPTLVLDVENPGPSPMVRATVSVTGGSGAGTVRFLDHGVPIGSPFTLAENSSVPGEFRAWYDDPRIVLAAGTHELSFRFTPTSSLVAPGTSTSVTHFVKLQTKVTITAPEGTAVGQPAVIDVTVSADPPESTSLVPEGQITMRAGDASTVLTLVDGHAIWNLDLLPLRYVTGEYPSNDDFDGNGAWTPVAPEPGPVAITSLVAEIPHRDTASVGTNLAATVSVTVPDDASVVVPGSVRVYQGDTLLTQGTLADGQVSLSVPTNDLPVGSSTLRFGYVPAFGYSSAASDEVIDFAAAVTTVSAVATPTTSSISWGDAHSVVVDVATPFDGARTLEVREPTSWGYLLLRTVPIEIVDGVASVPVDLTRALRPGTHLLRFAVTAVGQSGFGSTDCCTMEVLRAPTATALTTSLGTSDGVVDEPITLTATVAATSSGTIPVGVITFRADDVVLGFTVLDTSGTATRTYTPTTKGAHVISATFADNGSGVYAASSDSATVAVQGVPVAAPTPEWLGALTTWDTRLGLTYDAVGTHQAPTGTVDILDSSDVVVATGGLSSGQWQARIPVRVGSPVFRARYSGDSHYAGRTDTLPAPVITGYTPTVTLTSSSATVALGSRVRLYSHVTDVPLDLIASLTVYDTDSSDVRTVVGTATVDSAGNAYLETIPTLAGVRTFTTEVTFTSDSDLAPAASAGLPITISPTPVPDLVLSVSPLSARRAGFPLDLVITANVLPTGGTGLANGTVVAVRDAEGALLGSTTLGPNSGPLRGTLRLMSVPAGENVLHASAVYGPFHETVTSAPLRVTLALPVTQLIVSTEPVVVGQVMTVDLRAVVFDQIPSTTRTLDVTVVLGEGTPVAAALSRDTNNGEFLGTVAVPTTRAGQPRLVITTPGDGTTVGDASWSSNIDIARRPTTVAPTLDSAALAGWPLTVRPVVGQEGSQDSPLPTGDVVVNIVPKGVTCSVENGGSCVLPASAVADGANEVSVHYAGDDNNLPSTSSVTVTVEPRVSYLDVTFTPSPADWIAGEPVTASWSASTSTGPASGIVVVDLGTGATCQGPASAGSCTVTLAEPGGSAAPPITWTARFVSDDRAPSVTKTGTVTPRSCVFPTTNRGTIDVSDAVTCQRGTRSGVLTGSVIHVTPDAVGANYRLGAWSVNGFARTANDDGVLDVLVTGGTAIRYELEWSPTCFTLDVGPSSSDPIGTRGKDVTGGTVIPLTTPNCDNPRGATAVELAEYRAGKPRYLAGTTVLVRASYRDVAGVSTTKPSFSLVGFQGATVEPTNPDVASVVMTENREVRATFKVRDCVPVTIEPGQGGTLAVTSVRPSNTAGLLPASGACGDGGYVPGTVLSIVAKPAADTRLSSFVQKKGQRIYLLAADGSPTKTIVDDFAWEPVGKFPATEAKRTLTFVVPADASTTHLGAIFSKVSCVAVKTVASAPTYGGAAPFGSVVMSREPDCIGQPSTSKERTLGSYTLRERTDFYLTRGGVQVNTTHGWLPIKSGYAGTAHTTWSGTGAGLEFDPEKDAGMDWGAHGPWVDLKKVVDSITVTLNYYNKGCAKPVVNRPMGGSYSFASLEPEPLCPAGQAAPYTMGKFTADAALGAPKLKPMFNGGLSPATMRLGADPTVAVLTLEYCANLDVTVRVRDAAGTYRNASWSDARALMVDNGGCPELMSLPGRTVKTGLTAKAAYSYKVIGSKETFGPTLVVDAKGNISGPSTFDLEAICYSVTVGDRIEIQTPGNCPGDGNRYLKGTIVKVLVDPHSGEEFEHWYDVDGEFGANAWVIADRDRWVDAEIDYPSWDEKLVNGLSNFSQRIVAVGGVIVTGVVMAEMYVGKAVALSLKLATGGLRLLGVEGSVLDGMDRAANVITAAMSSLEMFSTCLNSWSHGSNATAPLVAGAANLAGDGVARAGSERIATIIENQGTSTIAQGNLGRVGTVVNAIGSNLDMYNRNAAEGWSNLGPELGTCMQDGLAANVRVFESGG